MKSNLHRILAYLGIDFRLVRNLEIAKAKEKFENKIKELQILSNYNIKTVLDIGANVGQFARQVRICCPEATIYSFEPLPNVYKQLVEELLSDTNVIPVNLAISNSSGKVDMYCNNFSPSSSLLPMADLHKDEMPFTASSEIVNVSAISLDDWIAGQDIILNNDLLIKMDVQGNELKVIEGGIVTLRKAKILIVEVSFYELYQGQPLFDDIYNVLKSYGFVYRGSINQYQSQQSKKILFADGIFENIKIL